MSTPGPRPGGDRPGADAARIVGELGQRQPTEQYARHQCGDVRFLRWHADLEAHVQALGLDHTVLRPNLFMQGTLAFAGTIGTHDWFGAPIGDAAISLVDTRDIAEVAAIVLTEPGHAGRAYTLTGPQALTHHDLARAWSTATGREIASEIAADGAVVAPGFVDVQTHYDGQATWESRLQPSSWHGVITAVMGNCGVGFAPALPEQHDRLNELMERVEDIPGVALHEGLAWNWASFEHCRDVLGNRHYDVDLASQVPHAALRVHAMGERAAAHEEATPEEIATMARLARSAVEAGALGFSTSRTLNHKSIDGELTPSYAAGTNELVAIAKAIGETGKGGDFVRCAHSPKETIRRPPGVRGLRPAPSLGSCAAPV